MRIGLIAPPWVPVPPPAYGGTESVIDNLARGLTRLGHEVRLFSVGESRCPVRREHLFEVARDEIGQTVPEVAHTLAAYDALAGEVDIIHDHTMVGPLLAAHLGRRLPPIVTTNHGPFTDETRRIFAQVAKVAAIISISHDQARRAQDIPIEAVIHHGIDLDAYQPVSKPGDYLTFVGRMSPDKGVHLAVQIARAADRPLRIVSKMREPAERAYFEEEVRPLLGGGAGEPEELPLPARVEVVRRAAALLNPIRWPEPFGLVMAESLAAGTPVIANACGAAPEIVTHGRTGFLVAEIGQAITAVDRIPELSRIACRDDAETRFSIARMARDHVNAYLGVLDAHDGRDARDAAEARLSAIPS